jgi:hypothetical protein
MSDIPMIVMGCGKMRQFMSDKAPEIKAWYKQRALEYRHLYPCPMHNGSWIYKEDCAKCCYAIKKPADEATPAGQKREPLTKKVD